MAYSRKATRTADRKVVVTGMGIITSMGLGKAANAAGFREGRNALRPITLFDVSRQRVGTGGEVDLPRDVPPHHWNARQLARIDRASWLLFHAAFEAWSQSGWGLADGACPVVMGTSAAAMALGEKFFRRKSGTPGVRKELATWSLGYQPQHQAQNVMDALGIESGGITVVSNACASGANAIGHALHLVRSGRANRVLCGGYDALCQLVFAGFDSLQALTPSGIPRPFDANRDGLALGEGAAVFCLETEDAARRRGADVLAVVAGYGSATDIHHLTQPHPKGDAALASMQAACREAALSPTDIGYLNSHGTGTPLNDIAEGEAILRWAGPDAAGVRVSSTKASIGHLLGGAGAVEAAICVLALNGGWLPPTTTVRIPDPVCLFDLVREPREARFRHALTNSFGFGGANATLIFSAAS
jgi:3-oxoacyl-[acyl-carrier-protein] synthase II